MSESHLKPTAINGTFVSACELPPWPPVSRIPETETKIIINELDKLQKKNFLP